jgi:hypothetical protein
MDVVRMLLPVFLALPLSAAGCDDGTKACFHWTEQEGACPTRREALVFFRNPGCESSVRNVDSDGEFDGELCCYEVTALDAGDEVCGKPSAPTIGGGLPVPDKPGPVP